MIPMDERRAPKRSELEALLAFDRAGGRGRTIRRCQLRVLLAPGARLPASPRGGVAPKRSGFGLTSEPVRAILDRSRARPWRLRSRLPCRRHGAGAPGRAQNTPSRSAGHARSRAKIRARSGSGLSPRPSTHRSGLRSGRGRAHLLHRLGILRGADAGPWLRLQTAPVPIRVASRLGGRPCRGGRARSRARHSSP